MCSGARCRVGRTVSHDGRMRLAGLKTRAADVARQVAFRSWRQTKDPNFIGFDKYRRQGAYHWTELSRNEEYAGKAQLIEQHVRAQDSCLDLGCGDGAYVYHLAGRCRSVTGIDADFDAIRLAGAQLKRHGVRNARVKQLPLSRATRSDLDAPGGFDVVYSMDVIEHLPDPAELLVAAKANVRPGGLVLVGTPLYVRDDLVSPYHVKEFTREEIRGIVAEHLPVTEEILLSIRRQDGEVYENSFYVSVSRMEG